MRRRRSPCRSATEDSPKMGAIQPYCITHMLPPWPLRLYTLNVWPVDHRRRYRVNPMNSHPMNLHCPSAAVSAGPHRASIATCTPHRWVMTRGSWQLEIANMAQWRVVGPLRLLTVFDTWRGLGRGLLCHTPKPPTAPHRLTGLQTRRSCRECHPCGWGAGCMQPSRRRPVRACCRAHP